MASSLKDTIRRIKEQADLVEVVSRYVQLQKAGATFKGRCPFHNEKTPSFNVRPQVGYFHCFGCGAGGTVIDFVMRIERLELRQAVEKLARELHIELPAEGRADSAARDEEERLRALVETLNCRALEFFRACLRENANPLANAYLPKRGLTPDLVERFQLGAAPDAWATLTDKLKREGYSEDVLITAGLSTRSEKGRVYDRFRNRLIFPIFDHNNRVVGFGGRALGDDPAKYINSAETALYKKSRLLYALNVAQKSIADSGFALLCEGYMDVVTAHGHGFPQAVASLGTALTPEQAKLLRRFTSRVFFLYDGDKAGQDAMLKGGVSLLAANLDARVIALPPEDDPDTFLLREGGTDALAELIGNAGEFYDFALEHHAAGVDLRTIAGQALLVDKMMPILRAMASEVAREAAISRLHARVTGIPRETIRSLAEKAPPESRRPDGPTRQATDAGGPAASGTMPSVPGEASAPATPAGFPLERSILKVMYESPDALDFIRSELRTEWLQDERHDPWIFALIDGEGTAQMILDEIESSGSWPGAKETMYSVIAWPMPVPQPIAAAKELLIRLEERHRHQAALELLNALGSIADEDARRRLLLALDNEARRRVRTSGAMLRLRKEHRRPGKA